MLVMVVFFIAFRWIHLSTPLIRLFLLVLLLLLIPTLTFLPVWFFFLILRCPPTSPLFPYTTLFRSPRRDRPGGGARGRRSATGNRRCGRGAGRRRPPLGGDRPEPGRRRDAGGRTRVARVRQHRCAPGETDDRGPRGAGRR